ncbi:MAG: RNA-binding S4 domain-containing protein [Actinobacteria bacterium]|nr:RNA-binding S4 domain-containing protein [Actinomycetota bacterium]
MRVVEVEAGTKLEQLLKYAGLYESGGLAKREIQAGLVKVNGAVEERRGRRLKDGDIIEAAGAKIEVKVVE